MADSFQKSPSLTASAGLTNGRPARGSASLRKLLESGVLLSAASLLTGLGNYAFQAIIGRQLSKPEFGLTNGMLSLVGFLSLPVVIATTTVTHYLARFNARGQEAHLQGLLAGCRKFLFRFTVAGCALAAVLVKPLSDFLHVPRTSLLLVVLTCVFAALWASLGTALCQGLAWFKRLALIGLLGVTLRLLFAGFLTLRWPTAEIAVLASAVALMSNLVLLFWRKELSRPGEVFSPWDREFVQFFIVSAACVGGGFLFTQGDMLVATRYFSTDLGTYSAAEKLANALPMVVAPLLTVLFTHRSGEHSGSALREQLKYLGFYAAGLVFGAVCLVGLRGLWVKLIFGHAAPESADMIERLAVTMVFAGLLQALGLWALASRWLKLALLYGALGLLYWLTLLWLGHSPGQLLRVMPVAASVALGAVFVTWLLAMRVRRQPGP